MTSTTTAAPRAFSTMSAWQQLCTFLYEELRPRPGRLRAALVRVAGVLLAMWFGYASNLPQVSAIVALAFFASSTDREESKKTALGVPVAVLVILLTLSLVLHVFGPLPLVRTLAFIVIVFTSLFLLQAAQQGQVFLLAGIFGKLFLELWDSGYPGAIVQQLQFYIVLDLAVAGLCALLVSYLFGKPGRDPVKEFRGTLAKRFELLARLLAQPAFPAKSDMERVRAETQSAQAGLMSMLDAAAKKSSVIQLRRGLFADLVRISQLLMHETVVFQMDSFASWEPSKPTLNWSADRCRAIAHMVRTDNLTAATSEPPPTHDDTPASLLSATVIRAEQVAAGRASLPAQEKEPKKGFFRSDAFTSSTYFNNAARAFAAAFACYCLISGADWSGIGTAVTTCLITSLTTVEQSRQKQSLRITGAAVGGLLTFFVLIFVLPTGIGLVGLSVVTALVIFLGAWIYAGGPNLNYAGVQLALCYVLGIFGDNKTPTSLTTVRDRIAGIFIGNLAMWLFFDRIRPAWTVDSSRCAIADQVEAIACLATRRAESRNIEDMVQTISRERETFAQAQSAVRVMSDANTPAFTPWSRKQQSDAPEIRNVEVQLNDLFSLEFVEAESILLRLPRPAGTGNASRLAASLHSLASQIRTGASIASSIETRARETSAADALLNRVRDAIARLFAKDGRTTV